MDRSTRAKKVPPHIGLLSPHAMDANPYARATNAMPGGEQAATGTPQAAAPLPTAPAKPKRPPLQKNEDLMATVFETAMQQRYYKVQFGGKKPEGSHGKKGAAAKNLRALLDIYPVFAGGVPSMETLDRIRG